MNCTGTSSTNALQACYITSNEVHKFDLTMFEILIIKAKFKQILNNTKSVYINYIFTVSKFEFLIRVKPKLLYQHPMPSSGRFNKTFSITGSKF